MLTTQELLEAAKKAEGGHANLAYLAGVLLGMATCDRYPFSDEERIYLAKASEYLRRHAWGQYYDIHGEAP